MEEKQNLIENVQSGDFDYVFSEYDKMCVKAKSILFNYIFAHYKNNDYMDVIYNYEIFNSKLTPIEQIFYVAYRLYVSEFECGIEKKTGIPINALLNEEIVPQQEIYCDGKKYIIDFAIDFSRKSGKNNEYIYPEFKRIKYAVELDGFDYHSNKKQMEYDYERENDLKKLGYKVVRFTGSQIYKHPLSCVDTLITIILNDINGE